MKKTITLLAILIATTLFAQTYVPDDNFEQALIDLGYDSGALDDYVPTVNINTITHITLNFKNISDLTGIEDFSALINLQCDTNNLVSVNLSQNTNLKYLNIRNNQLNSIDLTQNTLLTSVTIANNQLTSLDLSYNTVLNGINLSNNPLSTLDISNNTILKNLIMHTTQISSLDISQNPLLEMLDIRNSLFTSLDLSQHSAVTYLKCSNNQLISLNVKNGNNTNFTDFEATNNPNLTCIEVDDAAWSTANWTNIDAMASFSDTACSPQTYVPDDNFEQALIGLGYDSGPLDDYVPTANINTITTLYVNNKNIADLTGIQDFVALQTLYCQSNQLTSLDVSNNTALTTLWCYSNQLSSLDVSNNTALTTLWCYSNQLSSLDVFNNTALTSLRCYSNQLTSLDVFNNTALTTLWCYSNQLTGLDVSNNTVLGILWCYSNQLTDLDVSNNTALTTLNCRSNQLTSLDVSNNTALTTLSCSSNQLTNLDVSNNTGLTNLYCYSNQLTSLDVSNNTALTTLSCGGNQLTNLDVSNNTGLTALSCDGNQLTSLNVKNGNNTNIDDDDFEIENNPNLTCVEVDDAAWSTANWTSYVDAQSYFSENCSLSVNQFNLENAFNIYPNPVKEQFSIQNNAGYVIDTISIYTMLGKLIYQSKDIQNSIDVSTLSNGMYLIKLNSNNQVITKKILINK